MAGRIRSIKPEVLDDELMSELSDAAWRLYVSSWVLADDHGRFRAGAKLLAADVWQNTAKTSLAEEALSELRRKGFLRAYEVEGQRYAAIKPRGWKTHQRIDHPGKPRVPVPCESDYLDPVPRPVSAPLGEPRPSRARGGPPTSDLRSPTTDHDRPGAGVDEPTDPSEPVEVPPPESVEPEEAGLGLSSYDASREAKGESGYDLAKRIWLELWSGKYGERYRFAVDSGPRGEDKVLQRIGNDAIDSGGDAESLLRHKIGAYLRDRGAWVVDNRHPLRGIERDWNKYGLPRATASVTRLAKAPAVPEPPPLSNAQHLAALERARNLVRGIGDIAPKKESAG